MRRPPILAGLAVALAVLAGPSTAQDRAPPQRIEGHGGPVKGIAVGPDGPGGRFLATASFDYSVILRRWPQGDGETVLYGHDAAANAVAFLPDGERLVSAGDDGAVLVWAVTGAEERDPLARLEGHQGKIVQVAVSPDGALAATAGWDGRIGLWALDPPRRLALVEGHKGPVNAVAFADGGARLISGGYDGTIRVWSLPDGREERTLVRHGFGVNVISVDEAAGQLAYGAVDGAMRLVALDDGRTLGAFDNDRTPVLALARSGGGRNAFGGGQFAFGDDQIAFGDGRGVITVVDARARRITLNFQASTGPVWALAFDPTADRLLVGGLEPSVAVWPLDPLRRPLAGPDVAHRDTTGMSNGERQFVRKCEACHTLTPDGARRAGPTLHGLIGRRAGSVAGYPYSDALTGSDLVWTTEAVDALFAEGPERFIPGSKMPLQRMRDAGDRADLVDYLVRMTGPRRPGRGEAQ